MFRIELAFKALSFSENQLDQKAFGPTLLIMMLRASKVVGSLKNKVLYQGLIRLLHGQMVKLIAVRVIGIVVLFHGEIELE